MRPGEIIQGTKGTYELVEWLAKPNVCLARADDLYVVKGMGFGCEVRAYRKILDANPHLVRPHEIIDGDDGFIILPYLHGGTLDERLADDGPMALEEALAIFEGVCSGLAHLHSYGISHGDVHAGNILLTPQPVLIDLEYPDKNTSTDIHLAALTLREMLTGKWPRNIDFESTRTSCLDNDIAGIIMDACMGEYESITDFWTDLEEFI